MLLLEKPILLISRDQTMCLLLDLLSAGSGAQHQPQSHAGGSYMEGGMLVIERGSV